MIDNPRLWSALVEAWRRSDWHDGLVTARLLVEDHPDDLGLRFMLAALYLRVSNPALALLQYEKLLTSAVGQRDLWRALAAQRQLDRLGGSRVAHPRRFAAMLQWFRAVAPRVEQALPGAILTPGRLLRLSPDDFAYVAESVSLEELPIVNGDLADARRCVVLYGAARCSDPKAAPPEEWVTPEGQPIVPPGRVLVGTVVLVRAERPAAVLRFGAAIDECLAGSSHAGEGSEAAPAPRASRPAPRLEPAPQRMHAKKAEPSREVLRLTASLESWELRAWLAGAKQPVMCGRVLSLTADSLDARFEPDEGPMWREALAGHAIPLDLELRAGEDAVHAESLLGRETAGQSAAADPQHATFVLTAVSILDRARLSDALIRTARPPHGPDSSGEPPQAAAA